MWPLNFPVNWNNIKICHFLSPCFALFLLIWRFFLIMRVYSNKQASIHNLALSFAHPFPFQLQTRVKLIQRFSFLQPLSLFFFPPFYVCVYHPPPAAPHSCPNFSTVTPTSRRFCFKCPVEFNSKFSWFLLGIPSECAKSLRCISHLPASSLYPLQATFSKPAKNASDYPDQLPFQRPTWKSALIYVL